METAIGAFASRDRAEDAVKHLLGLGVPEQAIIFLTCAESEAGTAGKQVGATIDRPVGFPPSVAASLLSVPGIGQVFGLGWGAAALLGLGPPTDAAVRTTASTTAFTQPAPDERYPEDVTFFREVLQQGRSLVVVRTDSLEIAKKASRALDRMGLGLRPLSPAKMHAATRQIGNVAVIDISGRITQGEGNVRLREIVDDLLAKDNKKLVLNLGEVYYVDSSGMGELVRLYTSIRNRGGDMKLVNLSGRVQSLLNMTSLNLVFKIEPDEAAAVASFGGSSQGIA